LRRHSMRDAVVIALSHEGSMRSFEYLLHIVHESFLIEEILGCGCAQERCVACGDRVHE
jgi:hypothetical protein